MVIWTFGAQSTSSDHSQWRLPSSPSRAARMFTTSSKSVNSNRCGVSASRSFGPMSASRSIIANTSSMHSRSSRADSNEAPTAQLVDFFAAVRRDAADFLAAAGLRVRLPAAFARVVVRLARDFAAAGREDDELPEDALEAGFAARRAGASSAE